MLYCVKCALILDEDVQFCPICNEEDPHWQGLQEPEPADIPAKAFKGEVFDKLREINRHIEENPQPEPVKTHVHEDKPGIGLYIAMIMLSTCLSFVGLIVGIVYMFNQNKHYRTLGIVTLIISTVFFLSAIIMFFAIRALINLA